MYEVGLSKSFVAWHVMVGVEGPEGELHSHDYRVEIVLSRAELDGRGMVCDLDVVGAALDELVAMVADRNLEIIQPPDAEAVTVEVLARWAHQELARRLAVPGELSVRVWESPTAFGGYAAPINAR
ncbi:MAG: 6-carboxytetrahydropterin synthase [Actinomycetota bacterium]|nr:6-carboxytetrahydropterin synthase [Actinomycetota bacterium]